jgi:cyclopropane fatty-acyl-phospholipid synthase-like methyltransferase
MGPHVCYVGIEPSRNDAEIAARTLPGATIVNALAYDAHARLRKQFDSVVSFRALEHVCRRERYLRSAKDCLKPGGH